MKRLSAFCAAVAAFTATILLSPNARAAGQPAVASDKVVFNYLQGYTLLEGTRWNAVTHIGCVQTGINATGGFTNLASTFTNRDASLKSGGTAQKAGVKVILVVTSFDDVAGGVIESVCTNATNRTTLINNIVSAINNDSYCAGVNFDFEFSWGTNIRDGFATLLTQLRAALPASKEISVYVNASYSSSQWNATNLATNCDYVLQSGYDYATGSTAHAITDHNNNITALAGWFAGGIPPEKMVYTLSAYGRQWTNLTAYNQTQATKSTTSMGYTDGMYDTTLRTSLGGPFANNYVTGDECAWYTFNNGTTNVVGTWDNPDSIEYKIRSTLSFQGTSAYRGRHLKGIGYWSQSWMVEGTSRDPISGVSSSGANYQRTYPYIYQLSQEILSPPGTTRYVFNKFEGLNSRWDGFANSSDALRPSPDNVNVNIASSTRAIAASPAGAGAPPNSSNAMQLNFAFSGATTGKLMFRHEILNSNIDTAVNDIHAMDAKFSINNALNAYVYVGGSGYANDTVRFVVLDKNKQLEASPAFSLGTAGWNFLTWDLTNSSPGNVNALTTTEKGVIGAAASVTGNGILDTAGLGARDLGFFGFLVERNLLGSATGTLYFDELSYERRTPGNVEYTINEFGFRNSSQEFVEVKGPAGAFPANLNLRVYNSADGSVASAIALGGQTVPASGLFVVGDTGIANVNLVPAGWGAADNLPNTAPSALQIVDSVTGCVYDSVVYRAMGGPGDLIRSKTLNVTAEGQGWMGDTGSGTNSAGSSLVMGRYPDGADTNVNEKDFSIMPPTPGAANGTALSLPVSYNFTSTPASVYQTFTTPAIGAMAAGRATSPNGGNVWRCIDTAGGGLQGYIGDITLGGATNGYSVTGEIYLPPSTDPAQAIGIGICGRKGSNFFSASPADAGYESGYWLVYETNASATLNDGQSVHSQQFLFELANNNNQQSTRTLALGTAKTLANVGIASIPAAGVWATFKLSINTAQNQLLAQINGNTVYSGAIPAGGPTTGAFQVGYREFSGAAVSNAYQGTFLDNIVISPPTPNATVENWGIY
ncbi:MAG: glycoside hydrolase family 18 protein [Candidatus Sumerlaeaceae bacterium]|nr:glycoside hydrolase family 18 protein [Candidatus Sumerlaeaceae bacterium]